MQSNRIKVAIDGPAGAGKSTVARIVADKLGYVYVDTGAMYRAITWHLMDQKIDAAESERVLSALNRVKLALKPSSGGQQIWIDSQEVTDFIRTSAVTRQVSLVAQIPSVRQYLTSIQKQLSAAGGIVMDGRDIGTAVLPEAELKIFLTASVEERAERRYREMQAAGTAVDLDQLMQDIAERDRMDEQREVSPLRKAQDAVYVDCTSMTIDEVVDHIVSLSLSIINGAMSD